MILICTQLEPLGETAPKRAVRPASAILTKVAPQQGLPLEHCGRIAFDQRNVVDRSRHRRSKMIRDTERYLSDPHSKPWPRLSHAPPFGLVRFWRELCVSPIASAPESGRVDI